MTDPKRLTTIYEMFVREGQKQGEKTKGNLSYVLYDNEAFLRSEMFPNMAELRPGNNGIVITDPKFRLIPGRYSQLYLSKEVLSSGSFIISYVLCREIPLTDGEKEEGMREVGVLILTNKKLSKTKDVDYKRLNRDGAHKHRWLSTKSSVEVAAAPSTSDSYLDPSICISDVNTFEAGEVERSEYDGIGTWIEYFNLEEKKTKTSCTGVVAWISSDEREQQDMEATGAAALTVQTVKAEDGSIAEISIVLAHDCYFGGNLQYEH